MKKADYSIASAEERESVIQILQRNTNHLIEQKLTSDSGKLRAIVGGLCDRIKVGDVITGSDFETLVKLFQKKPVA